MAQSITGCDRILINGVLSASEQMRPIPPGAPVIYEVIRLMGGIPLFLEAHLERLERSLMLAEFAETPDKGAVTAAIASLTKTCSVSNQNLRINVWQESGGIYWTGLFVESHYPDPETYRQGVAAGLLKMSRSNPNAKVWQEELKAAVASECALRGLYEMILVDQQDRISEGSRSNLFFTQGNTLITAPDEYVLEGITRLKLLEIIAGQNIPVIKRHISVAELDSFDGAFITGTSIHLLPLRQIDSWERQSSEQPLIRHLMAAFDKTVEQYRGSYPVE